MYFFLLLLDNVYAFAHNLLSDLIKWEICARLKTRMDTRMRWTVRDEIFQRINGRIKIVLSFVPCQTHTLYGGKNRKKAVRKERIDDLFRKKSFIARYKTFESCPRLG